MVNASGSWTPRPSFGRVLGLVAAFAAWMIAGVAGLVLAAIVTALLVVAGLVGGAAVALTGKVPRARASGASDPDLIEAHKVGGHSWVAYGFDRR
jgi:NaMN:DMB phosphoribosyltransferase